MDKFSLLKLISLVNFLLRKMSDINIISLFENILDKSSIIKGEKLKSRFYHIWKTDKPLESICLLLPKDTEEVSAILKICNDNDQEIIIHGGLTNLVGSTQSTKNQVVVSLEKMNRIIEIDQKGKTITCESGVIIEDIINSVKEKDLLLPLNFGARGSAQIGGAVSTNAGGLRVFKYGMTRSLVLGLEAVLPDGTVISSLKKLMKDNSGYDLKQFFIGSEGTLGIVTKVVLRLYQHPKTRYTAIAVANDYQKVLDLLKFMEDKISKNLTAFELLWNDTYKQMVSDKTMYNKYLPDNYKYYVFIEYMGGDFENDYNTFEKTIMESLEKGLVDDAVLGKDEKEQLNIWGKLIYCEESRFINEIDKDFVNITKHVDYQQVSQDFQKKKVVFKPKGNLKKISSSALKNTSIKINFTEGDKVSHEKFGLGEIVKIEGLNNDVRAIVQFSKFGQKNLLLRFAKLNKV